MPRIVIIENSNAGEEIARHFYEKPEKLTLVNVERLDQIVSAKGKVYPTGMGIRLQVFPMLRPVLDRLGTLTGRKFQLDVDYTHIESNGAGPGSAAHARGYSERYEE